MISGESLIKIGTLIKPHGIKGEITANVDYDLGLADLSAIVVEIDGIYVPFFVTAERPKSTGTVLVSIEGCESETDAKELCGKAFYALRTDVDIDEEPGEEGGYVSDFIGYSIIDGESVAIGEITAYDDSTENVLFIITTSVGKNVYIPVADELITGIDTEKKTITMVLPEGLMDLSE